MENIQSVDPMLFSGSENEKHSGLLPSQESKQRNFIKHFFGHNRLVFIAFLLLVYAQFFIFKLFYPFPDFFSDSWSYIEAAILNINANIWPIGYSKFLLLFHKLTYSAYALNLFQFTIIEFSGLYIYKTITWFYPTSRFTRVILVLFFFFNPLNLYLANYVSSDGLFSSLSLIWITELLWILNRPAWKHIIIASIVFFIAFTFRYNAMFYPVITGIVLLFSRQSVVKKISGIVLGPLLIIPVIVIVSSAAKEMSGTSQFPPILGGWQWGNNALYIRDFIKEDSTAFPTPETAELDSIARQYFRTVPPERRELSGYVGNFFIKQWDAPLKIYMLKHHKEGGIPAWAKVAPIFQKYGLFIIKRHPVKFFRHFILMNSFNYVLPPLEKLGLYNLGGRELVPIVGYWFHYDKLEIEVASLYIQYWILFYLPFLFLLVNLYALRGVILFLYSGGLKTTNARFKYTVIVMAILLALNFSFSVFANIIVMRYQIFPLQICLIFALILNDYLKVFEKQNNKNEITNHAIPDNIAN